MKRERFCLVSAMICVCISYGLVRAQETGVLKSEEDLKLALRSAPTTGDIEKLLSANSQFVTERLWQRLMDLAAQTYYENHDQAFHMYNLARTVAERLRDQGLIAKTYYNVARSYSGLREFEKAKDAYLQSDKAFAAAGLERDRIYVLSDIGTIDLIREEYSEAKSYSQASIQLAGRLKNSFVGQGAWPDTFGVASALGTLAELSVREGNVDEALGQYAQSVRLYEELNDSKHTYDYYLADAYAGLGRAHTAAGDNPKALLNLNKALTFATEPQVPNILNSIGFVYMEQENFAQAAAHYSRSLKVYREKQNGWEAARLLLNLGVIEQRQNNVDRAVHLFREALLDARSVNHREIVVGALEGLGVMETSQRLFADALNSFRHAFEIAEQLGDRQRQAEILWREAETFLAMGDYDQTASRALSARDLARQTRSLKLSYLSATTLGLAFAKQNRRQMAIAQLKAAIDEIEVSRTTLAGSEEQLTLFFEQRLTPYHTLVELLLEDSKTVEALQYGERAKARVLMDVLASNRVDYQTGMTPGEREQLKRLNERMFYLNERLKKADEQSKKSLSIELDQARLGYQAFEDSVLVNHPELTMRSGQTEVFTLAELNNLAVKDTAYLQYVVTKDNVLLFVITKLGSTEAADVRAYRLNIQPQDLLVKVNQLRERIANRHPDFAGLARELYATLIGPAESQLKAVRTLCVIPDSFLWNVPFQALRSGRDRYLLEDFALYYSPSLSVLKEIGRKRSTSNSGSSLIAFGNPVISASEAQTEKLCPLPEAEAEVSAIARSFSRTRRRVFVGKDATEKQFRALASNYSTIHLATHGVIDNKQPLYSYLLLTTSNEIDNDGSLQAREILRMNLQAELAILSACETANGVTRPGEGVIGMSWAFFVAGTRSVMVSEWKVNSASTSMLMVHFYNSLQPEPDGSHSKSSTLRRAALRQLNEPRYRHPFYWAGFRLVGVDSWTN